MSLRQRGFTLIEIMVVLVILGVFTTLVLIYVGRAADQRISSASNEVKHWLEQVHSSAMLQGALLGVRVDGPTLRVVRYQQYQWYVAQFAPYVLPEHFRFEWPTEIREQLAADTTENSLPSLVFYPSGILEPEGEVSVTGDGLTVKVQWDGTGKIQLIHGAKP
ncbi:MAG: prepilin-type N-terminal cleavage/methylation domain-containing protein [Pseudomonadales bacterium]